MPDEDTAKNLPTTSPDAAREAREQAREYESIFAPTTLTLDDGTTKIEVPPAPSLQMFDDEAQAELNQLYLDLESYDRHDDTLVPEQEIRDKHGNLVMTLPPSTQRGPLKEPYRKTDPETGAAALLNPPYKVRVAQIALGDDYALLRAGTIDGHRGSAADVWRVWTLQGYKVSEREKSDSKSDGSAVDSAPVPPSDTA